MKEQILDVSRNWHEYYKLKHINSSERVDNLVKQELRTELNKWNNDFGFKGLVTGASTGQTNITRGPWFASFDTRVTESATQGYYVVFLFSTDMKQIILELGLGATQFTQFYGQNKTALSEIRKTAIKIQKDALVVAEGLCGADFVRRLNTDTPSIIDQSGYTLQKGYEKGAIFYLEYIINEELNEDELKSDYENFIRIYQKMIDQNLVGESVELVSRSIDIKSLVPSTTEVEEVEFRPRKAPKTRSDKISNSCYTSRRRSTKQIGDWGEKIIFEREVKYLESIGQLDLASKVVHEEAVGKRPGWDITSFSETGEIKRIEVKSSMDADVNSLNLTVNELEAARKYGDSYYLYLVTGVNSKGAKQVEILRNPAKLLDEGVIQSRPITFEIKLFGSEE